jgi:hypothetical protein
VCGGSLARRRLGVGASGPRARVFSALVVLVPIVLSGILLVAFVPEFWWVFTIYGWVVFPYFGLLVRGLSSLPDARRSAVASARGRERELLEALRREGELSTVRAAKTTSLTVAEADRMLRELAGGEYLDVRVRDGGLFYALWDRGGPVPAGEVAR